MADRLPAAESVQAVRIVPTPEAMDALGAELGACLRAGDLLVLDGPLGAGKTTFTRGLGRGLGVRGPVSSPTFVLARTHPSLVDGPPLIHVDAYRLGSPAELDDLDLDYAGSVVVVEWGAGMLDGVAESVLSIKISRPTGAGQSDLTPSDDETPIEPREVRIRATGPRWTSLPL